MNEADLEDLKRAVDFMRKEGVTCLKMLGLEITLGDAPVVNAIDIPTVESVDIPKKTINRKPGKDGYYAEQQAEIYGRVLDAEE